MSYVFEALQRAQRDAGKGQQTPWERSAQSPTAKEVLTEGAAPPRSTAELETIDSLSLHPQSEDRLVALGDPKGVGAEKFLVLASRIRQQQKQLGFRRLLITSCTIGDGKSLVTANLGISLARYAGFRVLLIDSDARHARLSSLMHCSSAAGLNDWLSNGDSIARYVHRYSDSLWCVSSGTAPESAHRRFDVDYLSRALESVNDLFDLVLVDSPPVTMLADATVWLGVTDMCAVVVRRGHTPKRILNRGLAAIAPSKMLGIILNAFNEPTNSYYAQYYGRATRQ